jgi:PiT family inorganic phosphate transporter
MFSIFGGLYLGWGIGANDASNVFGTAVEARIIRYRDAAILCASAAILGAVLQGAGGIHTLSGLTRQNNATLMIASFAAAITVTIMTFMRLPISTSQAIVGSIAGIGLASGNMYWGGLLKVVICWLATPIGALLCSIVIYHVLKLVFLKIPMSMLTRDKILWTGLVLVGTYGSYALGANNVANATGIFSGQIPGLNDQRLALLGGIMIALGVLTFSRRVMTTVGKGVMSLDAFTAFVAVSSMSVSVHVFAMIGVPVSTSQAIVGAIVGIGFVRGVHTIYLREIRHISIGWLLTPFISLLLAAAGYGAFVRH